MTIVTKTVTEAVTNSDAFRDDLRDAPRTITNATADACFGLAVAAWAEGVRAGTGRPFTMPRGGTQELAKLVDTLVTHCPDVEARTGWARAKGEAFARAGGKLSTHTFADWCNSPSTGIRRATPPVQAPPAGGRRWKVGGG